MTFVLLVFFGGLLWVSFVSGHIPKTGRDGKAKGEIITATITNTNKYADAPATLKAEKDGRKFKVKIKATEAHLWLKGDSIDIVLSEDKKSYRVLFNDYFKENEPRIREKALERLSKAQNYRIASAFIKYKKEYFESFRNSSLDSQSIFALISYIRMIDIYTVVTAIMAVATLVWKKMSNPEWSMLLLPIALILFMAWTLYSATITCNRIMKKVVDVNNKSV